MISDVIDAAREAGAAIERVRAEGFAVETKGDVSPVTEADRAADAILHQRLLGIRGAGWLSEETSDSAERVQQRSLWVVDPLDGTKEFIEGVPQYSVAIAFVEDGIPVVGVVHNPATGETFAAERGCGTTLDGRSVTVAEGRTLLASRSEMRRGEFAPFAEWALDPIGSIEYKLGLVAAGRGSVTLSRGPKWEWDVCAGALIVAEAGGLVTDVFGEPLVFNQPFPKVKGILAGAPRAYERALAVVRATGPSDRMDELR